METILLDILETAAITISGFLIKKYVFFRAGYGSEEAACILYCQFFLIGIVFLTFGKDMASMTALFMIGLNICLGRRKNRLWGIGISEYGVGDGGGRFRCIDFQTLL